MIRILALLVALIIAGVGVTLVVAPPIVERGLNKVVEHEPYAIDDATRRIHERLSLVDLHADSLLWKRDLLRRGDRGHVDVPRLIEGGFALQVFSAVTKTPADLDYEETSGDDDQLTQLMIVQAWPLRTWTSLTERALYQAFKLDRFAERSNGRLRVIRTRADLVSLRADQGRGVDVVGGLLAIEGAHALEGRLETIDRLWDAGYRMIGLTHFFDNELGGSLHGTGKGGLTDFGREAVARMMEKGVIIDLAHASEAMVEDVLDMGARGMVVSHTGFRGHCDSARNIPDDLMRRIAEADGLIGVGYWDGAVCNASPGTVAKAIAYGIDLVGEVHVALGSDFDGSVTTHFDSSEIAVLTRELLALGLDEGTVAAVMGGNALAFFDRRLPYERGWRRRPAVIPEISTTCPHLCVIEVPRT